MGNTQSTCKHNLIIFMKRREGLTLLFATRNQHKIQEITKMLVSNNMEELLKLQGLDSIDCLEEIPETHETIIENAIEKATYIAEKYNVDCFAEDSGLEVDALDGAPGVHSAHYAGAHRDDVDNLDLVLTNMEGKTNRTARYRTVIALYLNGSIHTFEGTVEGRITEKRIGAGGFGYDPIFMPDGYETTFGILSSDIKNKISHRYVATMKFLAFLRNELVIQ